MIEFLLLLGFILAALYGIMGTQALGLRRQLPSPAWNLLAAGFTVGGLRALWQFIQLPAAMIRAIGAGAMPERITLLQWTPILLAFGGALLIIAGLARLRRDLRALREGAPK
jgi:hypothetical protein